MVTIVANFESILDVNYSTYSLQCITVNYSTYSEKDTES